MPIKKLPTPKIVEMSKGENQAPIGLSQWRNMGQKYGYDKYFGIEWVSPMCACSKPADTEKINKEWDEAQEDIRKFPDESADLDCKMKP